MTNKTEARPRESGSAMDRTFVLRRVMEVLAVKGFARASVADLTDAAGVDYRTLNKTFGTRERLAPRRDPVLRRR